VFVGARRCDSSALAGRRLVAWFLVQLFFVSYVRFSLARQRSERREDSVAPDLVLSV